MRRFMGVLAAAVVIGVVASLAAGGSGAAPVGRWVPMQIKTFDLYYFTSALGINDRGWVLGMYPTEDQSAHYGLWRHGVMLDLGSAVGWLDWPTSGNLNDRGQVVGTVPRKARVQAFVWSDGKTRLLGTLPGQDSAVAWGINNRGQIVGESGDFRKMYDLGTESPKAFLWERGKMRPLVTPRGTPSVAYAINEHGWAVGSIGESTAERAAVWRDGQISVLPTLAGASAAQDINERGQIVGWSTGRDGKAHAVLWQNGKIRALDRRRRESAANAINDSGVIVGGCGDNACVWEDGRLTDLGAVMATAAAVDINNKRAIVGNVADCLVSECNPGFAVYLWTSRNN